ncbi:hypothetical protein COCON_G00170990 [Conger conger]|uniref:cysteine-S-conjugate beta-lyase n=1 Tax=Conger conger TaxID=82655 RepID=A0A9Q1D7Z0_CONCO|nr:hypothetical protein COCON_G00170990 [Conger conger]
MCSLVSGVACGLVAEGLATIPVSAFYSLEHCKDFENYIRFCFVKEDSTLNAAEEILKEWSKQQRKE